MCIDESASFMDERVATGRLLLLFEQKTNLIDRSTLLRFTTEVCLGIGAAVRNRRVSLALTSLQRL